MKVSALGHHAMSSSRSSTTHPTRLMSFHSTSDDRYRPPSARLPSSPIPSLAGNAQYEGEQDSGRFHGKGEFEFANGTKYVGSFKDGMFHGEGTLHLNTGGKYTAMWDHGKVRRHCTPRCLLRCLSRAI